jgi:4-amino-4-deoxy-L-arabinose transferase-like glycosyltransferase
VELVTFIALMVVIWRMSKRPRCRVRAVVYGWVACFLWALFWAALMPMFFRGIMDSRTLVITFPDGTMVLFFLVFGWFWPAVMVGISSYQERKKQGMNASANSLHPDHGPR